MKKTWMLTMIVVLALCISAMLFACGEKDTSQDNAAEGDAEAAHIHAFGDWVETKAPTCTKNGAEERTCACGEKETRTIEATGHAFDEWRTTTVATCARAGIEKRSCTVCGLNETRSLGKLPHTIAVNPAVAATCLERGLTEGTYCAVCNEVLTAQKATDLADHAYDEWTVETEATCTTSGFRYRVCTVCNQTQYDMPPAKGHQGTWTVDEEATCAAEGSRSQFCPACGKTVTEAIPMLEHDLVWTTVREADCSLGYEQGECRMCHTTELRMLVNDQTKSHVYGDDDVCTVCGEHRMTPGMKILGIVPYKQLKNIFGVSYFEQVFADIDEDTNVAVIQSYQGDEAEVYVPSTYANAIVLLVSGLSNDVIESVTLYSWIACHIISSTNLTSVSFGPYYMVTPCLSGCTALTEISIPQGVKQISASSFAGCTNLTTVTIPESATVIGWGAFSGCSSLTSVAIPESVISIEGQAFYRCTNLISIHYGGTLEQWAAVRKGENWNNGTGSYTVYCTNGVVPKYV